MCGIIGYVGKALAAPILLKGLKKLEYRGYDSCGMATINGGAAIELKKGAGRIEEVDRRVHFLDMKGTVGIAHTRWATHGDVSDKNAHPFLSCDGRFALIHNGILENYRELKSQLIQKGHTFHSETDTEVLVHFIEDCMAGRDDSAILESIQLLAQQAKGAFTFLLINRRTNEIYAFRKDSPLIVGLGEGEFFASSDVTSFLDHTNRIIVLENNQVAILNDHYEILDIHSLTPLSPEVISVDWTAEQASKSGYPHFMLKEINEEIEVSKVALQQDEATLQVIIEQLATAKKVFLLGSGTSYRACLVASVFFAKIAGKYFSSIMGSEFKTYQNLIDSDTVIFAVSQSGETADVLEGIRLAKKKGAKVLSLVNVMGSTILRESDAFLTLNAGPEIAVASTKAFTSQVIILTLLAFGVAGKLLEGRRLLESVISHFDAVISLSPQIHKLAKDVLNTRDLYLIGRGVAYPIAMEGELKIKEIAYLHADALAGGELKHHTLALIAPGVPCIALVPNDDTKDDMLNNIMQIKARGGIIIGIASEPHPSFDHFIAIPSSPLSPLLMVPVLQLLAYHLAVLRGNDPDFPRHLAKSVTVL
ncbi:MAG: glutamine--fructose-6-phosphate transaminase (isomerizing) [Candidatus Heimdallarchaeota archaeon]|nr:glutamine--fructose-6-phosphate transaminase (isomerizing) [Candidatus Heimdallarchaeota archaeon]